MTNVPLLIIRHAPTLWNGEKRLQGHTDIPLSDHSMEWVKSWKLPAYCQNYQWISSPLKRANKTAQLLSSKSPVIDPSLIEMNFGDWEGEILPDLRKNLGHVMQKNEDRGLDFTPPNGESPRQVQQRLKPLLQKISTEKKPTIAITHHGVMRALMAWATDWSMLGKAPYKLNQAEAHLFEIDLNGFPHVVEMNIKLDIEASGDLA